MSTNAQPDKLALLTAEEILRTLYGDDLKGCSASLDKIAAIIADGMKPRELQTRELLNLYEKVVEAVQVLSTPPDGNKVTGPAVLQSLLSDRLDKIHTIAKKTIETTASFQVKSGSL